MNVHVPTPTSSAPERCIVRASSGASKALSWPSTLIEALKCSGPSVTLDQRNASTDGSSTSSVRLKLSEGLRRLPSLRRVRPPSLPARKDSRVFAWLNSGLGGGRSALLGVLLLAATAAMTVLKLRAKPWVQRIAARAQQGGHLPRVPGVVAMHGFRRLRVAHQ